MKLTTHDAGSASVVRVQEGRVMYPMLGAFSEAVGALVARGRHQIVVDLSAVSYVDSATIGCLMDLYRQLNHEGGSLHLSGVQKRVETMLTMTGAQNFIKIHPTESSALDSLRS